jgi:GTP cyclohydrolase I
MTNHEDAVDAAAETVVDHHGTSYHPGGIVVGPGSVDYLGEYPGANQDPYPQHVLFGGVTNREALSLVAVEELAAELLKRVSSSWDPTSEHARNTPKRFVKSLKELCAPVDPWEFTTFRTFSDEMVTLGPIPFYTLCAHHVVPFYGSAWVGYVPDAQIAGLSKFARAVKHCAKGLWVQEELTTTIHEFISERLRPKGLAVVMRAEHLCMAMRGVQAPGVITTTAKMTGVFADHERTAKAEFMQWIGASK